MANIVNLLLKAGHQVETVGVLGSESYPETQGFVKYPGLGAFTEYIDNPFLMDDWGISELFSKNDTFYTALSSEIKEKPEWIHVEQPWLFDFAIRYKKENNLKDVPISYGSQNIEYQLKIGILNSYMGKKFADDGGVKVKNCEINALKNANIVYCVSENDQKWSRKYTKAEVILAQNGVRSMQLGINDIINANKVTGNHKNVLYCASAHPPNIQGFFNIFENGIGFLSPNEKIVVAGSASDCISTDNRFSRISGLKNHFIGAGQVSDSCLNGLINNCHVIALPITHGGGTNLKTAEAIWSGKYIVATPTAMRGFERFIESKGVFVSSSPSEFCTNLQKAMSSPPLTLSAEDINTRRIVLWEETLKEMILSISKGKI
ncbi:glycosyltransferase [Chromobacterium violaceum]|uniref:glycosyltransferase n=1 Tax=Chromobacterium violaceum TaxID=536 RepID=UPI001B342B87|nr:glycosyltransferase [Chromobacterium violaceum]MBP4044684.1 glycosyltransferase [Chromobacterium violaceum]